MLDEPKHIWTCLEQPKPTPANEDMIDPTERRDEENQIIEPDNLMADHPDKAYADGIL